MHALSRIIFYPHTRYRVLMFPDEYAVAIDPQEGLGCQASHELQRAIALTNEECSDGDVVFPVHYPVLQRVCSDSTQIWRPVANYVPGAQPEGANVQTPCCGRDPQESSPTSQLQLVRDGDDRVWRLFLPRLFLRLHPCPLRVGNASISSRPRSLGRFNSRCRLRPCLSSDANWSKCRSLREAACRQALTAACCSFHALV